jgi:FkbM family methyltransferase
MSFKKSIHHLARKLGYDFKRYDADNFVDLKRAKVIRSQELDLVLDIGAFQGYYVNELRETGYNGLVISFEPIAGSFKMLQENAANDKNWRCINAAVGAEEGEVEMSVSGHVTSSSLLPITETHLKAMPSSSTVSIEKIKVITLDSLAGNLIDPSHRIYMKVDVQGFEMFVLEGAHKIMNQVFAIELELSLTQLYQGGTLFMDMIKYMDGIGFKLVSLDQVFSDPNTDQLLQVDGIFKRL